MNIIGHKYVFLTLSGLLVLGGVAAFAIWGVKESIDFTGGSLLEIEFHGSGASYVHPEPDLIRRTLEGMDLGTVIVQPAGNGTLLRFKTVDEGTHQEILRLLKTVVSDQGMMTEKRFDAIGPTIGAQLRQRSALAIALATINRSDGGKYATKRTIEFLLLRRRDLHVDDGRPCIGSGRGRRRNQPSRLENAAQFAEIATMGVAGQ